MNLSKNKKGNIWSKLKSYKEDNRIVLVIQSQYKFHPPQKEKYKLEIVNYL